MNKLPLNPFRTFVSHSPVGDARAFEGALQQMVLSQIVLLSNDDLGLAVSGRHRHILYARLRTTLRSRIESREKTCDVRT